MPSRTVSPCLRSCLASGGASSFLRASAPKKRARDASDRLLPHVASTFTRSASVSGSLARVAAKFGLREPATGGPSVSRRSRPLWRMGGNAVVRGALARSGPWASCAHDVLCHRASGIRVTLRSSVHEVSREAEPTAEVTLFAPPVKKRRVVRPGYLSSEGTLRRIRWPRPRSRDRRTAFATRRPPGSALTPPWVCAGPGPSKDRGATRGRFFARGKGRRFRRRSPRARPPFTCVVSLFRGHHRERI